MNDCWPRLASLWHSTNRVKGGTDGTGGQQSRESPTWKTIALFLSWKQSLLVEEGIHLTTCPVLHEEETENRECPAV
jgi:hypothetical protein